MTSKSNNQTSPQHWTKRVFGGLLILIGMVLLLGGVYLIQLGGSWYYALAGIGFGYAGFNTYRGNIKGIWAYLIVFILTCIWAISEVGFSFWPLVPRLIAPIFLASLALFLVPTFTKEMGRPDKIKPFVVAGVAMTVGFFVYLGAMFFPHNVILNSEALTTGEITTTSLQEGNNWSNWGRTGHGTRYAPFDQITSENIQGLEVAWTANTGYIAKQDEFLQDQTTPIYVDGTLYHCAPAGQISAINGVTGEIKWQYDPKANSGDWKRCRALAYFDPGPGDSCGPRIISTTVDARLISVNTRDGSLCTTFGEGGTVNLFTGMGDTDPEFLTNSSGAIVSNGKIVLGGRVVDNVTVGEPSGAIRSYDAATGELAWVWDLGNPDLELPLKPGDTLTKGTPNAWAPLSHDEELGMVYVPLGNATPDIYGGTRRPFDDAYSSSVVALDVETGKEVWKFQTARHDIWDYDVPSQPVLADIPDGQGGAIPGLIQTTKRSQIFVLDRRTGTPIKQVVDKPAPQGSGDIVGEYYAQTQPYSVEMAAVGAEYLEEKHMWGATPIDHMMCRILYHKYNYEGEFTPPGLDFSIINPGMLGGVNFGSTTIDEERNLMVFVEIRMPMIQKLLPRDKVTDDMVYTGESGDFAPMAGTPYALKRSLFMSPLMIPCKTPPWGTISAIDLASGKHVWQQPAGTSEDLAVGNFKIGLPFQVGMPPLGGAMITKGGIAWYAGTQDFYMRAFDTRTGEMLWKGRLPTGSQGTPMSYVGEDGRQYVVISAGGARYNPTNWGDHVIAYALPE